MTLGNDLIKPKRSKKAKRGSFFQFKICIFHREHVRVIANGIASVSVGGKEFQPTRSSLTTWYDSDFRPIRIIQSQEWINAWVNCVGLRRRTKTGNSNWLASKGSLIVQFAQGRQKWESL